MTKRSAGVLLFRRWRGSLQFFLVHPGGPFWAGKDDGVWSIPKGEIGEGEAAECAATREFAEETGMTLEGGALTPLGAFTQPSGKIIYAFALEGDADASRAKSNLCRIEWPPKSAKFVDIPEIDRADWFSLPEAAEKITRGQGPIIEALVRKLESDDA